MRGFCDVTKASRKAKLKDIFTSLPGLVMSHHFNLQFETMTSRLIRMLISDHCETDLNGTRHCNLFSGEVTIVKTNNTR